MVYCSDLSPEEYSGYEIALWDRVRLQLGWEATALNWTCIDWDEMRAQQGGGGCKRAGPGSSSAAAAVGPRRRHACHASPRHESAQYARCAVRRPSLLPQDGGTQDAQRPLRHGGSRHARVD